MISINELIKLKGKKRLWMKVTYVNNDVPYETTLTCKPVYRPAPKSRLQRNRLIFSKIKIPIIKP